MKTSWTQGVGKELSIDITQNFKESLVMRRRLCQLIDKKLQDSWVTSASSTSYDNPNWPYLQADARGYERALREIISLVSDNSDA